MNTPEKFVTIPVIVTDTENYIEKIGETIPCVSHDDEVKYFLAEKTNRGYRIVGFSDKKARNLTCLNEIKNLFASEFIEADNILTKYGYDSQSWGTEGLHRDVEYFKLLAEQCQYLIDNECVDALIFWREKAAHLNFTRWDFLGRGGYYKEYLPILHEMVDGVEVIFDPNEIAEKAKSTGVVYRSVEEMLSFATAGELAYGGK